MSKYIVFRCSKCGKACASELRLSTLEKPATVLKKKALKCKYCNKTTQFSKAIVYDIYNLPKPAMDHLKRLNLENCTDLPLDEKMILTKIGENYAKQQTNEIYGNNW